MRKAALLLAALFLSLPAMAAEKPPELTSAIHSNEPYGEGTLNWMLLHVYDSVLWTDAKRWSYAEPFALSITYRMNFTNEELVKKSVEEMERIHGITGQDAATAEKRLTELFPDVKPGDRITALYVPQQKVAFYHNGTYRGALTEKKLLRPFLDIWLSPETERPEVRKQLLNLTASNG
jgi:hypothetical protein